MRLTKLDVVAVLMVITIVSLILMLGGMLIHIITLAESAKAFYEFMLFMWVGSFFTWMGIEWRWNDDLFDHD